MSLYKIFIPTRDSGDWLESVISSYRVLSIKPIFIADSRSIDNTIEILKKNNVEYYEFLPEDDYAEAGMIEFGSKIVESKWALRFDDDEFPSKKLISNLDKMCSSRVFDAWQISRREVYERDNKFLYSRWPSRIQYFINNLQDPGIIELLQPFPRLYRTDRVNYVRKVHTAGYQTPERVGYAESDAFFVHFQGLVKTPDQRLNKVRRYAAVGDRQDAWSVTDEYLPECLDPELFDFSEDGMSEFKELFSSVRTNMSKDPPKMTDEEKILMHYLLLRSSLNSRRSFNEKISIINQKIKIWHEYDQTMLRFIPKFMTKKISELFNTLSRLTGSKKFKRFSELLWKIDMYRHESFHN